jgi:hypothetical protein
LTRRANQGHYSIVAHCSASAAINLPVHIRIDDGISFVVVDSAGSSHEMVEPRFVLVSSTALIPSGPLQRLICPNFAMVT